MRERERGRKRGGDWYIQFLTVFRFLVHLDYFDTMLLIFVV